jgi:hypothetical protein
MITKGLCLANPSFFREAFQAYLETGKIKQKDGTPQQPQDPSGKNKIKRNGPNIPVKTEEI